MKALNALTVLFCLTLLGCSNTTIKSSSQSISNSSPEIISLNGEWLFQRAELTPANLYDTSIPSTGWETITVPANWYLEGHDFSGAAWYRKDFRHYDTDESRVATLHFEGVDYFADVWLNGLYLGSHEGYFQPFDFDITKQLRQGDNALVVRVDSPIEPPGSVWSLRKRLIKGVLNHHDTRPGGAWTQRGQEGNTGGIWEGVSIALNNQLTLTELKLEPSVKENGKTNLQVGFIVNANANTNSYIEITIAPKNFTGEAIVVEQEISLRPGKNRSVNLRVPIDNPKLWWPKEYGPQNLYQVTVAAKAPTGLLQASQTENVGLRHIRKADDGSWHINHKRFFMRGTNYISSQWKAEMSAEKYEKDVMLMLDANINVARVHAHIESKRFYDACDRLGLLVWQDFPLQWGYSDSDEFLAEAESQTKDMVNAFFNHPSIIAWSMHNEPPWDADWMKYLYPDYRPGQNKALDEKLFALVSKLDQSRYTHQHSATAEHPWYGWYSETWQKYREQTDQPLVTEFGAQALPNLDSMKKIVGETLWPVSDNDWKVWEFHNFQKKETFENAKIEKGENIEELIENTQHYQARLTQYAAESYRRQKYAPVGAAFQFMFVENWPSMNWGIVDYWREKKPGYDALKAGFQPVLPSIDWVKEKYQRGEAINLPLWIVNDRWIDYPSAQLRTTLYQGDAVIKQDISNHDIPLDSAELVTHWRSDDLPKGLYQLKVDILDQNDRILGHNAYQFEITDESLLTAN